MKNGCHASGVSLYDQVCGWMDSISTRKTVPEKAVRYQCTLTGPANEFRTSLGVVTTCSRRSAAVCDGVAILTPHPLPSLFVISFLSNNKKRYLSGNSLTTLPEGLFKPMPSLTEL